MKRNDDNIEEVLKHSLPSASKEQLESARSRVYDYATSDTTVAFDEAEIIVHRRFGWGWIPAMTALAVLIAAIWEGALWQDRGVYAVLETPSGSMYRLVDEKLVPIAAGERIESQEVVRSNGGSGGTFKLSDGSQVETRFQTEFSIESTEDGIRIRLGRGGLIVNAAKQQPEQHLYVQTRDVTVSVVGTVFLVNAEEEGSRVAVIEGEVRVQLGSTEKKLRPGEQVASNPLMSSQPMKAEIAWSRNAEAHITSFEQARSQSSSEVQPRSQPSSVVRETFEVTAVRLLPNRLSAGGRGDAPPVACMPVNQRYPNPQVDPSRFSGGFNLFTWIIFVYTDHKCPTVSAFEGDLLSGGPDWVKSDLFRIEASIPAGNPAGKEYVEGNSARLKEMVRTLLEDRFKLVVRRSQKQMHVLTVKVAEGGSKLTPSRESDIGDCQPGVTPAPKQICFGSNGGPPNRRVFAGVKVSSAEIVDMLTARLFRPVLDHTGLTGEFTFRAEYVPREGDMGDEGRMFLTYNYSGVTGPTLFEAIEKDLGLKVESTKASVDVLVIDRAERPSEN